MLQPSSSAISMAETPATGTVSIVITVYNEEPHYLIEAVESARTQTVTPHEIIIVEDGARRDYREIWSAFPDLKVIRQENQGLAAARNTGLAAATGEFILFLDGDDRMLPPSLANNLRRLADNPDAVMAYGGYRMMDGDGRPSFQSHLYPLGPDPYATLLQGNCIGMHAAVLYRREALEAVGGFDPEWRACEDHELYLRMARHGRIVCGSGVIAEYRYHGANMSGDNTMMMRTLLRVLDLQDEPASANPVWRKALNKGRANAKAYYARTQLEAVQEAFQEAFTRPRLLLRSLGGLGRVFIAAPNAVVGEALRESLKRLRRRLRAPVRFGSLRRTKPISRNFGYERGTPVDRHYIEDFLKRHTDDIRGRVLEVGDNEYTMRFASEGLELSEILHVDPNAPKVTYCTDLTEGEGIPDNLFDCIVLTQTLHLVYEFQKAVKTLHRILKPGGVLLITVPGVSSIDSGEWGDTWFYSFTPASLRRMMQEQFGEKSVEITSYGNVLTAAAFLYGISERELRPREFHVVDPQYPVIVAARVTKQ